MSLSCTARVKSGCFLLIGDLSAHRAQAGRAPASADRRLQDHIDPGRVVRAVRWFGFGNRCQDALTSGQRGEQAQVFFDQGLEERLLRGLVVEAEALNSEDLQVGIDAPREKFWNVHQSRVHRWTAKVSIQMSLRSWLTSLYLSSRPASTLLKLLSLTPFSRTLMMTFLTPSRMPSISRCTALVW